MFIYSGVVTSTHIVTEAMSQQIDELELQLQDYERANNQSRWNEQALEGHLSVWETYSTRSNKIMGELYEACSGRWLLFERLSRNSQKKSNKTIKTCNCQTNIDICYFF